MRQWYRGTMDSTTNQKQPEISFSPHTPLGFPGKRKRSHTGCAQEFGEFSTLSVTCSIHSREESGGTVLKPCTYHMTLSRAPKERPPSALSVRFLYDRRDTSGFGWARAQGPTGTKNVVRGSPLPTESLHLSLMHTCSVSNTKDSHSPCT